MTNFCLGFIQCYSDLEQTYISAISPRHQKLSTGDSLLLSKEDGGPHQAAPRVFYLHATLDSVRHSSKSPASRNSQLIFRSWSTLKKHRSCMMAVFSTTECTWNHMFRVVIFVHSMSVGTMSWHQLQHKGSEWPHTLCHCSTTMVHNTEAQSLF